MKKWLLLLSVSMVFLACSGTKQSAASPAADGWISLFDGKTLNNWKVGDNAGTFSVENGTIKVNGNTAHLFYVGDVQNHNFKNFDFKTQVMTMPNSNSGIYFHTNYQQGGWPEKGYEVQVNNSHTDWRRTGGLYAIEDVKEKLVNDSVWYTERIRVEGKHVQIWVNDKQTVDYTEPDNVERPDGMKGAYYRAVRLHCKVTIPTALFISKTSW